MEQHEYEKFVEHQQWLNERVELLFNLRQLRGSIDYIEYEWHGAVAHYSWYCRGDADSDTVILKLDELFGDYEEIAKKTKAAQAELERKQKEKDEAEKKARTELQAK